MRYPLRIALVVDPFRRLRRGTEHSAALARELLGRGHLVRGFGAAPGAIPGGGVEGQDFAADLLGFRPDVVVAYAVDSPAAWKGARTAERLGVPLVLVEEGFPTRGRTFGRFLRAIGARLWGSSVRRNATRVLALDPAARQQLIAQGFDSERVQHLPSGIDLTAYRPGLTSHLPSAHGVSGLMLLVCAGLREEVGLDRIVRAFAETVGRGGAWSLVLAGEGPAGPALRALAHQVGVGANVHWLPPAKADVLPGLYGASTLFLAPSDPADVGGWRVRRALACGLPVLAQSTPGQEPIIEHDGCGLLVDGTTETGWVEALRLATVAPERRRRWGGRAREVAEARYAWSDVVGRVEDVLFDVIEEADRSVAPEPEGA